MLLNKKAFLIVFLLLQLITVFQFFRDRHYHYIAETLIIIVAVVFITWLDLRKNLPVSNYLYIIALISFSGHTVGGELFNLYLVPLYDKFLHVFGIYSFAMLGYILLGFYRYPLPGLLNAAVIIAVGLSLGALYELWEFAIDQFMKPEIPAQSGLVDTNLDLLADLAGSVLAALHLQRKKPYV